MFRDEWVSHMFLMRNLRHPLLSSDWSSNEWVSHMFRDVTWKQKNPGALGSGISGLNGGGRERWTGCRALRLGGSLRPSRYFVMSRTR
jgi:hypothetical protein